MIKDKNARIQSKSPHAATKRFVAYVEDSKTEYDNLLRQFSSDDGYHFVYTNRSYMQANEDTCPIKDTSKFYQFCPSREKDIYDIENFPPLNIADDGTFTCRVCSKQYKAKAPFKIHEDMCKLAISSKKAYCIEYREAPCYCKPCRNGELCQCHSITGTFTPLWMVSLQNQKDIQAAVHEQVHVRKLHENIALAKQAISTLQGKYNPVETLANIEFEQKEVRVEEYQALSHIFGLRVVRCDGRNSNPRKADYINSLRLQFDTWEDIKNAINSLEHNVQ
jgi:hypothetical protein